MMGLVEGSCNFIAKFQSRHLDIHTRPYPCRLEIPTLSGPSSQDKTKSSVTGSPSKTGYDLEEHHLTYGKKHLGRGAGMP